MSKPTFHQIFLCASKGKPECPDAKCAAEFFRIPVQNKPFANCFIHEEGIIVWQKTMNGVVTTTKVDMRGKNGNGD